jgi:hypothetical protein
MKTQNHWSGARVTGAAMKAKSISTMPTVYVITTCVFCVYRVHVQLN